MDKKIIKKEETKETKKAMWLGAQRLMNKPTTAQEQKERNLILMTARVLGVSPFGVNILGNTPYINKLGLMQKAKEYTPNVRFVYQWIKYANDDTEKAICACKIVDGNKELTDWVIGECSPSTQKMGTLKGYQNHMAQTRARNRAILEAFGIRIHEEMMANIEKLYTKKEITENEASKIGNAVTVSAEEIQPEEKQPKALFSEDRDIEELFDLARQYGAKVGDEKRFIEDKIGHKLDLNHPTKKYISMMKAQFLAAVVK
jgi:replicative superfamily II helicase